MGHFCMVPLSNLLRIPVWWWHADTGYRRRQASLPGLWRLHPFAIRPAQNLNSGFPHINPSPVLRKGNRNNPPSLVFNYRPILNPFHPSHLGISRSSISIRDIIWTFPLLFFSPAMLKSFIPRQSARSLLRPLNSGAPSAFYLVPRRGFASETPEHDVIVIGTFLG